MKKERILIYTGTIFLFLSLAAFFYACLVAIYKSTFVQYAIAFAVICFLFLYKKGGVKDNDEC